LKEELPREYIKEVKMKRSTIIILSIIGSIAILITSVCGVFVYKRTFTKNVFEDIYYEVKAIEWGKNPDKSVLLSTDEAYADFDFGDFQKIRIPELDVSISNSNGYVMIMICQTVRKDPYKPERTYVKYRYNVEDKTLYGERDFEFLEESFLKHYFEWCESSEEKQRHSLDDLGDFTFEVKTDFDYYYT
jgi:hypothetical protein